ncbi:hypothetical protein EVAR_74255_1 [Eumeta japonica]|uniref:MADF domain-containing protein n=1 Tax=Eumeta variegata TaxID=151549 RepID=A0A4C1SFI6_EUMVA|nr:hypothetical protein EVAR_74255_1 [Eumeta japonica]
MDGGAESRPGSPTTGADDVFFLTYASAAECEHHIVKCFIEAYEASPELWDPANLNYTNKVVRNKALDRLLVIYSKWKPNSTRDDVRKKINSLRSNFRKELRKVEKSQLTARSSDEVYAPSTWTYSALQFLTKVNINQNHENENNNDFQNAIAETTVEAPSSSPFQMSILSQDIEEDPQPAKRKKLPATAKQNKKFGQTYEFLQMRSPPSYQDVTLEPLAIIWTEKLRRLNPIQRLFAEKGISDILFEAELNNLHRYSVQINTDPLTSSTTGNVKTCYESSNSS